MQTNQNISKFLVFKLRAEKSRGNRWNCGQQQLYIALIGKRDLWSVRCCPKCLEEVAGDRLYHTCGELVVEVQIKEPKKIPGGYVSPWALS